MPVPRTCIHVLYCTVLHIRFAMPLLPSLFMFIKGMQTLRLTCPSGCARLPHPKLRLPSSALCLRQQFRRGLIEWQSLLPWLAARQCFHRGSAAIGSQSKLINSMKLLLTTTTLFLSEMVVPGQLLHLAHTTIELYTDSKLLRGYAYGVNTIHACIRHVLYYPIII